MIQKLTLLVTILLTTISCSRKMEHSINDTNERVKQYLDGVVKKEIPGIQYLVLNKEGPIFEYNGGWRDVKNDLPVTPNTTFMMNSSTKPIVALAILQLVQKGALSLDDSFSLYFQEHPYGDGAGCTCRRYWTTSPATLLPGSCAPA
jgi:CubicO group peptidase (beta-lactamase class C family)